MFSKRSLTTMMAVSIGLTLAGCAGLPTDALGSLTSNLNPQQKAAVSSMVNDAIYAVQSDTSMDMATAYTSSTSGGMTTQALDFATDAQMHGALSASESAKASASFGVNFGRFRDRLKERLDKHRGDVHNTSHTSVTNANGTVTVTDTMTMDHKNGTETHTVVRTYASDKTTLVEIKTHFERTNADGMKIVMDRDRLANADGSWTISFNATLTRKDGKTKSLVWTRTENADGTQSGTGTLTRFDGSTETITFSKSADGTEVTKTTDSQAAVATQVTKADASTDASVQVSNTTSGQVTGSTTVSNTDTVEPSDK